MGAEPAISSLLGTGQMPYYSNFHLLHSALSALRKLSPLVSSDSIFSLQQDLLAVNKGNAFFLHVGDCAESMNDSSSLIVKKKCEHYINMASYVERQCKKRIVLMGRIAGQFAKPRTNLYEEHKGKKILTYRGDIINSSLLGQEREPDPLRMIKAYYASRAILKSIQKISPFLYTSHECLLLPYEYALTRWTEKNQGYRNCSTDFLWLGVRTLEYNVYHDYLKKIINPIGIKIGPSADYKNIAVIIKTLASCYPDRPIVIITRLGHLHVSVCLPTLIKCIKETGLSLIWCVDPMHGNTAVDQYGKKYRKLAWIEAEIIESQRIHQKMDTEMGGLHLEVSFEEDINECIVDEKELTPKRCYRSLMDPRLNKSQCFLLLEKLFNEF